MKLPPPLPRVMSLLASLRTMLRRSSGKAPEVPPAEACALQRDEDALVLDVREAFERRRGHVPGSVHVPLGEVAARADELPRDRPIVVHCAAGTRSAKAAAILREKGFDARNVAGGMIAWKREGLPVETGRDRADR